MTTRLAAEIGRVTGQDFEQVFNVWMAILQSKQEGRPISDERHLKIPADLAGGFPDVRPEDLWPNDPVTAARWEDPPPHNLGPGDPSRLDIEPDGTVTYVSRKPGWSTRRQTALREDAKRM